VFSYEATSTSAVTLTLTLHPGFREDEGGIEKEFERKTTKKHF
jgi:hypothetical protein